MNSKKIATLVTSVLLAGGAAWADDKDKDKGAAPEDRKTEAGNNTVEKIQQGVKNTFAELKFEDLPAAVQKTVREHSRSAKINDIDREDRTGRTIYEVEFETDGMNREIHVAANGTLLNEKEAGVQLGYDRDDDTDADRTRVREKDNNMKFSDLPAAVQATVKQQGSESQIADIDSYRRSGKRVYEIEFRRDGPNREIHVGEDGKIMDIDALGSPGTGALESSGKSTIERTPPTTDGTTTPSPTPEPTGVK